MTCAACLRADHRRCTRGDCSCSICVVRTYPRSPASAARETIRKTASSRARRAAARAARPPRPARAPKPVTPIEPLRIRYVFPPYVAPVIPAGLDVRAELRRLADDRLAEIMHATGATYAEIARTVDRKTAGRIAERKRAA